MSFRFLNGLPYYVIARAFRPVAISWYNLSNCYATSDIVSGDSHVGPVGLLGMTMVTSNSTIYSYGNDS